MEGEWTRVVPLDKELRAYLRWRWLRNGWVWDPGCGEKRRAERRDLEGLEGGGVVVEGGDGVRVEGVQWGGEAMEEVEMVRTTEVEGEMGTGMGDVKMEDTLMDVAGGEDSGGDVAS